MSIETPDCTCDLPITDTPAMEESDIEYLRICEDLLVYAEGMSREEARVKRDYVVIAYRIIR